MKREKSIVKTVSGGLILWIVLTIILTGIMLLTISALNNIEVIIG